jgi:hypothetical protein
MADIVIEDLTSGNITTNTDGDYEWTGTGVFDKLISAVNQNIKVQFDSGRLTSETYGEVYLGSMQSVISQSMQFLLQEKVQEAQIELIARQTKGFDDDAKQKLLKQALDSWSVAYSVAQDANSIPDSIKVNPIDSIMKDAMDSLEITVTNDPIGES